MSDNKRALIICDLFPLGSSPVGAITNILLVKMLKLRGWDVGLFTISGNALHPDFLKEDKRNEELLKELPNGTSLFTTKGVFFSPLDIPRFFLRKRRASLKLKSGSHTLSPESVSRFGGVRRLIGKIGRIIYPFWTGYIYCYRQMVREGLRLIQNFKPSIIISISPHPYSLPPASRLSILTDIPWVAILRDRFPNRIAGEIAFGKVLNTSSAVIIVFEEWDYKGRKPRLYRFPVGFDSALYPSTPLLSIFTITAIVRNYELVPPIALLWFLKVVRCLKQEFSNRFPFKARFYMTNPFPPLHKWREEMDLQDVLEIHPPISHTEMLKRECESAVLLMFRFYGYGPQRGATSAYGRKFWEYLGTGRPILRIGRHDTYEAKLLRETGAGVNCESEREVYDFLKKAIEDFYTKGDVEWHPDKELIASFDLPNRAKILDEILEKYRRK
jgi:hypothetical protein